MRTIAQFGIRDADGADSQITEVAEPRSGGGSVVGVGSSLKNVETATTPQALPAQDYASIPAGVSEMSAPYESSIVESPPLPLPKDDDRDDTPTGPPGNPYFQGSDSRYRSNSTNATQALVSDYFPPQNLNGNSYSPPEHYDNGNGFDFAQHDDPDRGSHNASFDPSSAPPPPPRFDSKPTISSPSPQSNYYDAQGNDLYSLPSQSRQQLRARNVSGSSGGAGIGERLRVANAGNDSDDGRNENWPQEAIMHMNLARGESTDHGRYDGSGYGGYGSAM